MAEAPTTGWWQQNLVAILALIVSMGSPFVTPLVTYRWLQNDLRIRQIQADNLTARAHEGTNLCAGPHKSKLREEYWIILKNSGPLPVDKVRIGVQRFRKKNDQPAAPLQVDSSPPARMQVTAQGDNMILAFEDAVAPQAEVDISLTGAVYDLHALHEPVEPTFWLSSEAASFPVPITTAGWSC